VSIASNVHFGKLHLALVNPKRRVKLGEHLSLFQLCMKLRARFPSITHGVALIQSSLSTSGSVGFEHFADEFAPFFGDLFSFGLPFSLFVFRFVLRLSAIF